MNTDIKQSGMEVLSRRRFLRRTGAALALSSTGLRLGHRLRNAAASESRSADSSEADSSIAINRVNLNYEFERLKEPYGFKGGYVRGGWHPVVLFESSNGHIGLGLGKQSPLWSDASVARAHTASGGNALMYAVTEHAIQKAKGMTFTNPPELLERLLPEVHEYAATITEEPQLRLTFTLNALVPVDNAAWTLYAREHGIRDFMEMIPERSRPPLEHPGDKVASVPALSYDTTQEDVRKLADAGYFLMKIKLGNPGDPEEMLKGDQAQMEMIHNLLKDYRTELTADGRIPYYLDMNMRYRSKEMLRRLLDHADKIGAFDRIIVVEDPFPDDMRMRVDDVGVRMAADEPAHTADGIREQLELGYSAIALKPAAKTLSMTLSILHKAARQDVPTYCADLSVNPTLREWNKMVAARIKPFPGLGMGMLETNGHQFYAGWERMMSYHPYPDAAWADDRNGAFHLDADYYEKSGGLFDYSNHYLGLVQGE